MITTLRTQQIYIDLPTPGAEPWINIIVQRVEMDEQYKPVNVVDRWGQVSERISKIADRQYPLADPFTPPPGSVSAAGIANSLTLAVIDLIIRKYGGVFDQATGYIILE